MDSRLSKINNVLINYSLGKFDSKVRVSSLYDEIDAFIVNINMLGEELKASTISKNYFNNIFHSVSDMIFVLDKAGRIKNINKAVTQKLLFDEAIITNESIDRLLADSKKHSFSKFKIQIKQEERINKKEVMLKKQDNSLMTAQLTITHFTDERDRMVGYLVTAKDITQQKETEKIIVKTIIDTQEQERIRFAKDIHDSLGQQLSGIKFYLGTILSLNNETLRNEMLQKSNDALSDIITDMRNICFDLMPKTLENYGLVEAINELIRKVEIQNVLSVKLSTDKKFPQLIKTLEYGLFRITQEFLNNTIKHASASIIDISLNYSDDTIYLQLKDNGKGFEYNEQELYNGMGLKNIVSRVEIYNGTISINSAINKGTRFKIAIPYKLNKN